MSDPKNVLPGGPVPGGAAGPDAPDARKADPATGAKARAAAGTAGKQEVEQTRKHKGPTPGTVEHEAREAEEALDENVDEALEEGAEQARAAAEPKKGAYVAISQLVLAKQGDTHSRREIAANEPFDATDEELAGLKRGVHYKANAKR